MLATRGYERTTTNAVAAAAFVSIGSLYQYFPGKDALIVALAHRHIAAIETAVVDAAAAMPPGSVPLPELVRRLVRFAASLNEPSSLHAVLALECARTPELDAHLRRLDDVLVGVVADHLRAAGVAAHDADLGARLLVAGTDAALHRVVLASPPEQRQEALAALERTAAAGLVALLPPDAGGSAADG